MGDILLQWSTGIKEGFGGSLNQRGKGGNPPSGLKGRSANEGCKGEGAFATPKKNFRTDSAFHPRPKKERKNPMKGRNRALAKLLGLLGSRKIWSGGLRRGGVQLNE